MLKKKHTHSHEKAAVARRRHDQRQSMSQGEEPDTHTAMEVSWATRRAALTL